MKRLIFILAGLALAASRPAEESSRAFASAGSYVYTDRWGNVQTVQYTNDGSGIKITSSNVPPEDVPKVIEQIQKQMNFQPIFPSFSGGFPFWRDLKENKQETINIPKEEEAPFLSTLNSLPNKPTKNQETAVVVEKTEPIKEIIIVTEKNDLESGKKGKMMDEKSSEYICIPSGLKPCDDHVIINITEKRMKEESEIVLKPTKKPTFPHPIVSFINNLDDSKPYPPHILEDTEESKPFSDEYKV